MQISKQEAKRIIEEGHKMDMEESEGERCNFCHKHIQNDFSYPCCKNKWCYEAIEYWISAQMSDEDRLMFDMAMMADMVDDN